MYIKPIMTYKGNLPEARTDGQKFVKADGL